MNKTIKKEDFMQIIIKNTTYQLYPRIAKDVLDLSNAIKTFNDTNDDAKSLVIWSKVVCDSILAGQLKLSKWTLAYWKLNKFKGNNGIKYVLNNCSVKELIEWFDSILELEDVKKKVLVTEKQLEEK